MAMMEQIMNGVMTNPDVFIIGALLGFIVAKFMGRRKRGMMGGGGMI